VPVTLLVVTVATAPFEVPYIPPVTVLVNTVAVFIHMLKVPVIEAGVLFIVAVADLEQPLGNTYTTVVVPPEDPVSTPDVLIGATVLTLLLHVPPAGEQVNVDVVPVQMLSVPPIAAGAAFTVITAVATLPDTS
jgi:hypothetical protein